MYSKRILLQKYLHYYFTASNGKGHGIHSPFVFDFVQNVLNDKRQFYTYTTIEYLRGILLNNQTTLHVEDLGAGSTVSKTQTRTVASIAKHAAKNKKLAQLLFRVAHFYQPSTILELGTSLGISAAYLASACPNAKLYSIEGSPEIAQLANANFRWLGLKNIYSNTGNFDAVLPTILQKTNRIDLAFIDGNHRKAPTLNYFHQLLSVTNPFSILIFDDIHWSQEMEEAWDIIKKHEQVTLTIDLFFIGLVFFRKDFKVKQDFVIRF
jgi:predicted O-methyltransferase YrrM